MAGENDVKCGGDCGSSVYINIEPCERTPLLTNSLRINYGYENDDDDDDDAINDFCSSPSTSISSFKLYRNYCDIRLIPIVILLVGGFSIATYLLVTEYRLPSVRFTLDLVNREVWSKTTLSLGKQLNHSNVINVILMQTGHNQCLDSDSCFQYLKILQRSYMSDKDHYLMPHNFLIGDDGQTYEIQGWDHENGFEFIAKSSSLVIGLIGNYTRSIPSEDQLTSVNSLINESIRRRKLQINYQLFGVRNLTKSNLDGEQLFRVIRQWKHFQTLLTVL